MVRYLAEAALRPVWTGISTVRRAQPNFAPSASAACGERRLPPESECSISRGGVQRMRALLPSAMDVLEKSLAAARVPERLYTTQARKMISDDLIVHNVGVSSAYQSPPHFDVGDVGWTFAFACKCGECRNRGLQLRLRGKRNLHE